MEEPEYPEMPIPTFEEVLSELKNEVFMNIQLTRPSDPFLKTICDLFKQYDMYETAYFVTDNYDDSLRVRAIDPEIETCPRNRRIKMDTADFVRGTTAFDMDMMAYLFDYTSSEKLNSMYNSTIEFQDLKAYGAAIEHIEVFDYVGFTYIPFECPNSLVAIISDFILSLDVVDVAVVYSINSDGIKFSVRSERPDVDAGKLIYQALDGIGSGGGQAAMAGGFVSHEALNKIGRDYDRKLKELFMKTIRKNRGV